MSNVNHPKHYNQGKIEVIEFLEDQFMDRPHEWNAVKYLARAGRKDAAKTIEDLEKAIWYIKRKIELVSSAQVNCQPKRPNEMNRTEENRQETAEAKECLETDTAEIYMEPVKGKRTHSYGTVEGKRP